MSWPLHGPVDERDDYRDRDFVKRIARAASFGVVLSGVSRSGKTTLLHRARELFPDGFGPMISLEMGCASALAKLSRLGDRGALLDEGQCLLRWTPAEQRELISALEDRPFILATWPSIFDPSASEVLERWLERPRFERLPPLSRAEAAAMIRRARSEAPIACDEATVEAIFEATGGHPALIARLTGFLSDNGNSAIRYPRHPDLELFVESVRQWNDPFMAMFASLPSAHQEAVRELSHGSQSGLTWLIEHNLAYDHPPRFRGKLFTIAWLPSSVREPPPPESHRSPQPLAFLWVHLSDIHFGAGDRSRFFDRQVVTRAVREDAQRMARRLGPPDRVLVTGDIAAKADAGEYEAAHAWLAELTDAVGVSLDRVRLVPGNHDIDRTIADRRPTQRAHEAIRGCPEELDGDLFDGNERSCADLGDKLAAYRKFVAEQFPDHPPPCPTGVDWAEVLPAVSGRRGKVRLAGLSTVWVSDRFDGRDKQRPESRGFCPNLVVSRGQLEHAIGAPSGEVLLLLLSHHPPDWLDPKCARWLASALANHAHVHLTGHVHAARAAAIRQLGQPGMAVHYVAGALHGDPTESYGYAWGGARWNGEASRWEIGWAPRVYVAERQSVVADRTRYPELGEDDFAWEPVALGWGAPACVIG